MDAERKKLAEFGWRNWYINRGRFSMSYGKRGGSSITYAGSLSDRDERMVSWRRAL